MDLQQSKSVPDMVKDKIIKVFRGRKDLCEFQWFRGPHQEDDYLLMPYLQEWRLLFIQLHRFFPFPKYIGKEGRDVGLDDPLRYLGWNILCVCFQC
jgi:hypothetical protein